MSATFTKWVTEKAKKGIEYWIKPFYEMFSFKLSFFSGHHCIFTLCFSDQLETILI